MNPYEAPQTVDQPPKKPRRRHWLWPDFSSSPRQEPSGWSSLGIVAAIIGVNMLRSCSSSHNTPNRIPSSTYNSSYNQPPKNSPAVEKLLKNIRDKRNQTSPQPSPPPFE